jgi:sugar lactone lactonase YvrE
MQSPDVVATGIGFPEGLAWSARDGTLLCTGTHDGAVWRIWPDEARTELVASFGGGANNLALTTDGGCLVTQNGGIDAGDAMLEIFPGMTRLPRVEPATPGLLRIHPDGRVEYLIATGLNTPNDIAVTPAGELLITDPGNPLSEREQPPPRVLRVARDLSLHVVAEGFAYCNGIFVTADEQVLVTDHHGVVRVAADGGVHDVVGGLEETLPDGLCADRDGRLYVAAGLGFGVHVVEDGAVVETLAMPGDRGFTSNCAFGGPDGTWLFATDAVSGTVVRWTDMPAPGQPVRAWDPPA